jgi:hypothetical protein
MAASLILMFSRSPFCLLLVRKEQKEKRKTKEKSMPMFIKCFSFIGK